jgi:hypothetical protein
MEGTRTAPFRRAVGVPRMGRLGPGLPEGEFHRDGAGNRPGLAGFFFETHSAGGVGR